MKKVFLIYLICFSINYALAQNMSFLYEMTYKTNVRNNYHKKELYYLDVSDKESVFRSEYEKSSDSLIQKTGFGLGFKIFYNHQYYTRKSLPENKVYKIISTPIFSDIYYLRIEDLDWRISTEKLKIGDFNCQKAELNYGGRKWIAWFTQEIPLQEGPYIFNGLPGLIIKISDVNSDYHFELVKIKKNANAIPHLQAKKEVTWEILKKMELDFYKDPYAEVRTRNIGYVNANEKGEKIQLSMKKMTESMQKNIRDNDNFIELDHIIIYD